MAIKELNTQRSDRITVDLRERMLVLGRRDNGWTKELNIVAWNRGAAKFDIREWDPEHNRMSKGVTLTDEEAEKVVRAIADKLGIRFADDADAQEDDIPFESSGAMMTASAEDKPAHGAAMNASAEDRPAHSGATIAASAESQPAHGTVEMPPPAEAVSSSQSAAAAAYA